MQTMAEKQGGRLIHLETNIEDSDQSIVMQAELMACWHISQGIFSVGVALIFVFTMFSICCRARSASALHV